MRKFDLFENVITFLKGLDRRVKVAITGSGIQNWSQSLSVQYNQLYAEKLGAGYLEIGSLNSLGSAITSIISVPLGWAIERYGVKMIILLGLGCSIISSSIYYMAGSWWILIPAIILSSISMRIINPLTDVIFVSSTKTEKSGTVMGLSRVVWGIIGIFAPATAAVIVANFGGINASGIRPLYVLQVILAMIVFLYLSAKLEPLEPNPDNGKEKVSPKISVMIQNFKELFSGERWLKRWVILFVIRNFGMSIAMPFTALWLVNVKNADPYTLGAMGSLGAIASTLLQIPVGRLADRIGRKKAFYLLRPLTYVGTLLMILAPRPEYLILVGLLGAVGMRAGAGGVSFTPFITMHWEMVPEEKRGRWFGMEGFTNIATIPATILGGILWQLGFMKEVLLIPILLEVMIVIPILYTIPDTLYGTQES
jgi:MFS family permease